MSRPLACALLVCAVGANACGHPPRWVVSQEPTREEVEILLETGRAASISPRVLTAREFPDIPVRTHLRPCCAFGSELRVSLLGVIPIPGYKIPNVIGPDGVGPHTYDSGVFAGASDDRTTRSFGPERNGLLYTCRGGFIDTAHVRDYVDWAIYFAAQIGRRAIEGGEFTLPDEGGQRRVIVRPLPAEILDRYGLGPVVITLAQWLSFQTSIWHEIATWYGWESVPGISERASAFSPEDLYSNMLGSKLMLAINAQRQGLSEPQFNRGVDGWFGRALEQACPDDRSPVVFANPLLVRGIALADYVTFEIEVDHSLARQEPFASRGRHVTQADFPELVSQIVEQARAEFGPFADRPN